MKPARICVDCGQSLKDQRGWHRSTIKDYVAAGTSYDKERKYRWCIGPRKTPGREPRISGKPVHFRNFAGPHGSICGLHGGRVKGKYADRGAEVSWSRIRVELTRTTCERCLVLIIQSCKKRLHERLKATNKVLRTTIREAHAGKAWRALKDVVNA